MAIKIGDNLNYAGTKPDFVRQQYATFEEMLAVRDNGMPQLYLAYCLQDKNIYKYDKDNEVDPVTGKFRVFQSGGGGEGEHIQYNVMPIASATYLGKIVQYTGTTDVYTQGYFYLCSETSTDVYEWVNINVQAGGGSGGTVDTEMSDTSTNAVQNKVIKAYVDSKENTSQVSEMPEPTAELVGKVVQYVGPDDGDFYTGYFYICDEDSPDYYDWFNIQVQDGGGSIDIAMSDTSTNAVQNKVIKSYVDTTTQNTGNELRSYVDERISESITAALSAGY